MVKIKTFLLFIMFMMLSLVMANAYMVTTTNISTYLTNNDFNQGTTGWSFQTSGGTCYQIVETADNRKCVFLGAGTNPAGSVYFQTFTPGSSFSPIELCTTGISYENGVGQNYPYYDGEFARNTTVEIYNHPVVRDGLIVKVWIKGASAASLPPFPGTSETYSNATINGSVTVLLQSNLALAGKGTQSTYICTTTQMNPLTISTSTAYENLDDNRIYEVCGLAAYNTHSIAAVLDSWHILSFTFLPSSQTDWGEIRNIQIAYNPPSSQPQPTGIMIDKVELYALQIEDDLQ